MAERRAHRARQPRRDVKHDRVAVAQVERQRLPRHGRAVAHADQLHGRAPALGRAEDHVVRHSPARAARLSSPGQGRGTPPDATARQVLVARVGGTQLRTAYTATPVHFPCGLQKVNRAVTHRSAVCPARGSGAQPAAWGQRRPYTLPRNPGTSRRSVLTPGQAVQLVRPPRVHLLVHPQRAILQLRAASLLSLRGSPAAPPYLYQDPTQVRRGR